MLYFFLHTNILNRLTQYVLGLPDMVLLWRAIVRQTYETLHRHINPTSVAGSVLLEEDAKEIAQTEWNKGRSQAVDQFIYKLLKLKDLRWTNTFPIALKKQRPEVFDVVTKAKDDLLKEDVFSRCRYTVSDLVSTDGGILELQQFDVRLEIPGGALRKEEDISMSIISPKDGHPPLNDNFILAPMVVLEPDGHQFLKPVTLTVKHSGIDLKLRHLQVWKKTGMKGTIILI